VSACQECCEGQSEKIKKCEWKVVGDDDKNMKLQKITIMQALLLQHNVTVNNLVQCLTAQRGVQKKHVNSKLDNKAMA
jgi:hypothetical protein